MKRKEEQIWYSIRILPAAKVDESDLGAKDEAKQEEGVLCLELQNKVQILNSIKLLFTTGPHEKQSLNGEQLE